MDFNEKLQFSKSQFSWNLFTCHKINLRLILVGFLRFQSLVDFMASQSGLMPSFLIRSSFLKIRYLRIKNNILLKFKLHWLQYVGFFLLLRLTPFNVIITSNLHFHNFFSSTYLLCPTKTWISWGDISWSYILPSLF